MIVRVPLTLSVLCASSLVLGCFNAKVDTGGDDELSGELWDQWEIDDDEDDEPDVGVPTPDTGTTGPDRPNPYSYYDGWQAFAYRLGHVEPEYGEYDCFLVWDAVGSPVDSIPETCPDCLFLFDVYLAYDKGEYEGISYDDGSCAHLAGPAAYVYGYTEVYGYGQVVIGYGSSFYPWSDSEASFDGGTFHYNRGYRDYEYGSYLSTYYTYGYAQIR